MQTPQKRLGRGLSSLISMPDPVAKSDRGDADEATRGHPLDVPVDQIRPNSHQPRQSIGSQELESLAQSISQSGLIQPVILRRQGRDGYELIAGERRWRACQQLGMKEIPAIIRDATDRQMLELALVENIFREDLNPLERAEAYRRYADEFGLSADDIAHSLGEDRSTVANYIRLLDLPDEVKELVSSGQLSMGHARCLLGLKSPDAITRLAKKAIDDGLSVRTLERLVRERLDARQNASKAAPASKDAKRPQVRHLEEAFVQSLGTKVEIQESRRKGSGKITIHYYSLDDFDRIAGRLGVEC
jgi:ParB family chromosome partitioning protein